MGDAESQFKVLSEGLVDLISVEELRAQLSHSVEQKKPLRIKYGADPSSPDLHLGHTVPLRKLRQFQALGHQVVFIIGDFTARIGDPSQRSETRAMLSTEEVQKNAVTYQEQVFGILDRARTEVRYNSEWLDRLTPADFLHLTSQYTVARLLERDDFQKRFRGGQPIAVVEFLYPLLQGYDSVVVKADIELGGTDQKFNLLVGRELQKVWGQKPQVVMTLPLLEGTDGVQKMSKSFHNAIALQDAPREMFGKVMSLPDSLIERYYEYASGVSPEVFRPLVKEWIRKDPRHLKAKLAEDLVASFHGAAEARRAREEFDRVFRDKGLPDDVPDIGVSSRELDIVTLLKESGLVASKGEGRRLIEQGGVSLDQARVSDPALRVSLDRPRLIQCGRRKFARVRHRDST